MTASARLLSPRDPGATVAVCVDVGSTFTKLAVVDLATGDLVATASHRTTLDTDVLHGVDTAIAAVAADLPGVDLSRIYACSSAGGGLRLAVIGYEPLVTAEAGHRVGLSAGAKVVHVAAGRLDREGIAAVKADRPDVVLLVGGTDGGDEETLIHNATRLGVARLRVPVVLAGNADVRTAAQAALATRGVPVVPTENVLPRIGVLNPMPARLAIREVFLRHVIGGKKLSRGPRFASLVRGATPDIVLTAVELLADHPLPGRPGDLVVIDIGGATTDVYSVLTPDAETGSGRRPEVSGVLWRSRTVEGDLGMRWSAPGVVSAAVAEKLPFRPAASATALAEAARHRADDPAYLPAGPVDQDDDLAIAALAATVALRRHARGEPVEAGGPRRGGKDLRDVSLVIGSGGVLRHGPPDAAARVLGPALADRAGGWPLPRAPRAVIDVNYVLAAAGLLAPEHPAAAISLLHRQLSPG